MHNVAFDPVGEVLAIGDSIGLVHTWDTGTGRRLREFTGHHHSVSHLAFSPDGRTLAIGVCG